MSFDLDFDALVLAEASLLDLERARNPALFDLLVPLSLAARAELELVRAMRQQLFPAAESGLEADLWASPVLQAADLGAVVLLPDVRAELHESLAQDQDLLEAAWKIVQKHHENLDAVILLEERTIYHTLRGDLADAQVELGTILNALQTGTSDPQLLRWTSRFLHRLPAQARDTGAAIELADEFARQTGGEHPAGFSKPAPDRASTVTLGVRRVPQGIWITCPPEGNANPIDVPRTDPVKLSLSWPTAEGWEEATVEIADSAIAKEDRSANFEEDSVQPFHQFLEYPAHDFGRELLMKVAEDPAAAKETPDFKYDVYVSYASIDSGWVNTFDKAIQAHLRRRLHRPVRIWIDQQKLRPNEEFSESIDAALWNSAVFIPVISRAYLNSEWQGEELQAMHEHAALGEKRIFPVFLDYVRDSDLPEPLRRVKHYRFFDQGPSGATRRLDPPRGAGILDRQASEATTRLARDLARRIEALEENRGDANIQIGGSVADQDSSFEYVRPGQLCLRTVEQREARLRFAEYNPLLYLLLDQSLDELPALFLAQCEDLGWRWETARVGKDLDSSDPVVWVSTPNDDLESDQDVIDLLEDLELNIIRSPSGGGDLPSRTQEQIARARAAVVLFDEHSFDQEWFHDELAHLLERKQADRAFVLISMATTEKSMDRLAKDRLRDSILTATYPVEFAPRKKQLSDIGKQLRVVAKTQRAPRKGRIGNEEAAATALVFSDSLSFPEIAARIDEDVFFKRPELRHALLQEQRVLLARVNRKGEGLFAIFGVENPSSAAKDETLARAFASSLHRAKFDEPESERHLDSFRRALLTLEQSSERRRIERFLAERFTIRPDEEEFLESFSALVEGQPGFLVAGEYVWTAELPSEKPPASVLIEMQGQTMPGTLHHATALVVIYRLDDPPADLPVLEFATEPIQRDERWITNLATSPKRGVALAGIVRDAEFHDVPFVSHSLALRLPDHAPIGPATPIFAPLIHDGALAGAITSIVPGADFGGEGDLAYAISAAELRELLIPPPRLELVDWNAYRPGGVWAPPDPEFFKRDPDPRATSDSADATRWGVATPDGKQFQLLYERKTTEPGEDPTWKPVRLFPPNDCTALLAGWLSGKSDSIESHLQSGWELDSSAQQDLHEFIESILDPPGPIIPGLRWRIAGYEPGDENPENPDGHSGTPRSLAMSPSGAFAITAGNSGPDQSVKLWHLPTGKLEGSLEGQAASGGQTAVALSEDGARFVTSYGHDLRLWDAETGKKLAEWSLKLSNAQIVDAAFAGDDFVIAATHDHAVLITIETGESTPLGTGGGNHLAVAATEKGDLLAVLRDDQLTIWINDKGKVRISDESSDVGNLKNDHLIFQRPPIRFTPDEALLFGSPQAIWTERLGVQHNERQRLANVADYAWDGTAVWATSPGSIQVVDRDGEHFTPELQCNREISCAAISADGSTVLAADLDHHLWVWWLGEREREPGTSPVVIPEVEEQGGLDANQEIVLRFLENWPNHGFNIPRILKWGAKRRGFEGLRSFDHARLEGILRQLIDQGLVKTFASRRTGSTLYQFRGKDATGTSAAGMEFEPGNDPELVEQILAYLDRKGFTMLSFERIRKQFNRDLSDEDLELLIENNSSMFGRATLKGGKRGLKKL